VQVLWVPPRLAAGPRPPAAVTPRGPIVAVSTRPRQFAERLADLGWATVELAAGTDPRDPVVSRGPTPVALVADPATWQSHFGIVASLRATRGILLDGCSVAEFRAVTGCRELPPPIASTPGACWLLEPDGTLGRVVPEAAGNTARRIPHN
jgi:S-DNA-T family DNA segregation ATPase FtsK/SpoIIIE